MRTDRQEAIQADKVGVGPLLEAQGLSHIYPTDNGGVRALADLSFTVARHEIIGVVGPSGCGKTTLLKVMAGLLSPTEGKMLFEREVLVGPRRRIGLVSQKANLMPWRTVIQNISLPLELRNRTAPLTRSRAIEMVELVGLEEFSDTYPHDLSGGMEQRVAIGRALIHAPDVLLLDEPFGALDALTREKMGLTLLEIWSKSRPTIVFVTHSITEAVFLADRVLVLTPRPGRIRLALDVKLPRPRELEMTYTSEFGALARQVRAAIG